LPLPLQHRSKASFHRRSKHIADSEYGK